VCFDIHLLPTYLSVIYLPSTYLIYLLVYHPSIIHIVSYLSSVYQYHPCVYLYLSVNYLLRIDLSFWSITQPQRRMKSCHLPKNGWNWRASCWVK
jgi:hypothetical protein